MSTYHYTGVTTNIHPFLCHGQLYSCVYSVFQGSLTADEELALMLTYHYTGATTNIHPFLSAMVNYILVINLYFRDL